VRRCEKGGRSVSEFLASYGFFILVLVLFLGCHLLHFGGHGGHGGGADRDKDKGSGAGGHQH
jgi:hypothetical protein